MTYEEEINAVFDDYSVRYPRLRQEFISLKETLLGLLPYEVASVEAIFYDFIKDKVVKDSYSLAFNLNYELAANKTNDITRFLEFLSEAVAAQVSSRLGGNWKVTETFTEEVRGEIFYFVKLVP